MESDLCQRKSQLVCLSSDTSTPQKSVLRLPWHSHSLLWMPCLPYLEQNIFKRFLVTNLTTSPTSLFRITKSFGITVTPGSCLSSAFVFFHSEIRRRWFRLNRIHITRIPICACTLRYCNEDHVSLRCKSLLLFPFEFLHGNLHPQLTQWKYCVVFHA